MNKMLGKRIYLRTHEMRDKEIVFAGAHEPVGAKLTGTHGTFTMEQIETYIERNQSEKDRYAWVICLADDSVVGEVVINEVDRDNNSGSIRIALFNEKYFGQGYGTEAMQLAVKYGFEEAKLHRISLGVFAFNPRAIHVYEKVGFTLEGRLRDTLFWEGEYHDEFVMSILATD